MLISGQFQAENQDCTPTSLPATPSTANPRARSRSRQPGQVSCLKLADPKNCLWKIGDTGTPSYGHWKPWYYSVLYIIGNMMIIGIGGRLFSDKTHIDGLLEMDGLWNTSTHFLDPLLPQFWRMFTHIQVTPTFFHCANQPGSWCSADFVYINSDFWFHWTTETVAGYVDVWDWSLNPDPPQGSHWLFLDSSHSQVTTPYQPISYNIHSGYRFFGCWLILIAGYHFSCGCSLSGVVI